MAHISISALSAAYQSACVVENRRHSSLNAVLHKRSSVIHLGEAHEVMSVMACVLKIPMNARAVRLDRARKVAWDTVLL